MVTWVSLYFYIIEQVQFETLRQPHCDLIVVTTTAYLKALMEVNGQTLTGLGPLLNLIYIFCYFLLSSFYYKKSACRSTPFLVIDT